mmetsp:Transcript_140620/g.255649  ORF Transcript_140620/g.255649 Transcript_140620/m.255649 type:complete len:80 (+) Transcript_140620:67-306(+)
MHIWTAGISQAARTRHYSADLACTPGHLAVTLHSPLKQQQSGSNRFLLLRDLHFDPDDLCCVNIREVVERQRIEHELIF